MLRRARPWRTGLVAVVAAALIGLAGCDWTQSRFDAARTGDNPASGLSASNVSRLRLAWSIAGGGQLLEANGFLVATNPQGQLTGFNASDGSGRWASISTLGAAIDHNVVYVATGVEADGWYTLDALSLDTGQVVWSARSPANGGGSAAVSGAADGKVYVTNYPGPHVYFTPGNTDVWDTSTHKVAWTIYGAVNPAVADGVVFYQGVGPQSGAYQVVAVDEQTGKQLWGQPRRGNCSTDTIVSDGYVFVDGATYRAKDGTFVGNWVRCVQPAVVGTTLFGVEIGQPGAQDQVVSFDGVTGAVHWSDNFGTTRMSSGPAVGNDVLFLSNGQGIVAFDTATGRPVGLVGLAYAGNPIVVDGTVYVATTDKIYALRPT